MSDAHGFERTTCACAACVACCKRQPGPLVLEDVARISVFLGEPVEPLLVASPGAIARRVHEDGRVETLRVGSITPASDATGRCVFLDAADRCRIHAVAPFGCAFFDVHMPARTWQPRSAWMFRRTQTAEYQRLRATLPLKVSTR